MSDPPPVVVLSVQRILSDKEIELVEDYIKQRWTPYIHRVMRPVPDWVALRAQRAGVLDGPPPFDLTELPAWFAVLYHESKRRPGRHPGKAQRWLERLAEHREALSAAYRLGGGLPMLELARRLRLL